MQQNKGREVSGRDTDVHRLDYIRVILYTKYGI